MMSAAPFGSFEGNIIKSVPMEEVLSNSKSMDLDLYDLSRIFY